MKPTPRVPSRRALPRLPFLSLQMLEGRDVPAVFYVDPSFAPGGPNDTDADAATPGNQPAAFGTAAFNSINAALAVAVNAGDQVVVNANNYPSDAVNLTTTGVNLLFQDGFAAQTVSAVQSIAATAGTITVNNVKLATAIDNTNATSTTIAAPIDGTGGLLKRGTGMLTLSAANTFTGGTFVSAGKLMGTTAATLQQNFGPPSSLITLGDTDTGNNNIAFLLSTTGQLRNNIVVSANPGGAGTVTIGTSNAAGTADTTSGDIWFGANSANGGTSANSITINRDVILQAGAGAAVAGARTIFNTRITGTGNVLLTSPFGSQRQMVFYKDPVGMPANDFVGSLTIGTSSTGTFACYFQAGIGTFMNNKYVPDSAALNFGLAGATNAGVTRYAINGASATGNDTETFGALNSQPNTTGTNGGAIRRIGGSTTNNVTITVGNGNANGDYSGAIEETGSGRLLFKKVGSGTQILRSGKQTSGVFYTGGTQVAEGTLLLGNTTLSALGSGAVTVDATGTLGSINTANAGIYTGSTTVNGILAPGNVAASGLNTTGILTTGSLTFGAGGQLKMELQGTTAGFGTALGGAGGYDQVVAGNATTPATVNLTNASLVLDATEFAGIPIGTVFTILRNASNGATSGQFNGIADNQLFTSLDGQLFRISYHAAVDGDGQANDITVTRSNPSATFYVSPTFTSPGASVDGDLSTPATEPATVGTNAFATITAALTAPTFAPGDTVIVNQGTYTEVVNDTITAALQFVQDGSSILGLTGGSASSSVQINTGVVLTIGDNTTQPAYSGLVNGSGGLIKVGSGTLTLAGTSSYLGATTVSSGVLAAGGVGGLSSNSVFAVAGGASLQLGGFNQSILNLNSLPGSDGTIENGGGTNGVLSVGGDGNAVSWSGTLQDGSGGGTFGFRKIGAGDLVLPTQSGFTGPFTLSGGTFAVAALSDGGSNSPIGKSTADAANFIISGGATLKYTGAGASSSDRSFTWGAGGGTIEITEATGALTFGGTITPATPGTFVKSGPGRLAFTADNAFQAVTTGAAYGVVSTGNVTVSEGQLDVKNFRVTSTSRAGTGGNARTLTIAAGARVRAAGTVEMSAETASYATQIAGPGTLELATTSGNTPNLAYESVGPSSGNGSPYGTIISAVVDIGTISATVVAKANRNDTGRYSGDVRFGSNAGVGGIIGQAGSSIRFQGISSLLEGTLTALGKHAPHFVLNADNSGFLGSVVIANSDLLLTRPNALTAANSVTFDSQPDSQTTNRGGLFTLGRNFTIGSLNDTHAPGTTSLIHNGAGVGLNGLTGRAAVTGSTPLGVDSDSTLTIAQTANGDFFGTFDDGGNDRGETGDANISVPGITYRKLNVVKQGTGRLTLGGTSTMTGTFALDEGTLFVNGSLATASSMTIGATATLASDNGILPATTVAGTFGAGGAGTAGQLTVGNLSFAPGSKFQADILGTGFGEWDKVVATGTVDLGTGSNSVELVLNSTLPSSPYPAVGTEFVIIESSTPITGNFLNLPEGALVTVGGVNFTITYMGGGGTSCSMVVGPPGGGSPVVSGFTVNSGYTDPNQRSRLTEIQVNFASPVTAGSFNGLGNIMLSRTKSLTSPGPDGTIVQTGAAGVNQSLITVTQAGPNGLRLTFSVTGPDPTTAGVEYGSLSDGYWQLSIPSAGGYTSGLNSTVLRRLFGDIDNNGTVEGSIDFPAFGNSFNQTLPITDSPFDFNADGIVEGSIDFPAFGANFNVSL